MRAVLFTFFLWAGFSSLVNGQDKAKFTKNYPAEEILISNLHTLSIHIQEPALHDSVFRFLTEMLQLPVYYQP